VHDGRVLLGTGTYALALVDASFAPGTPAGWGLAEVRHTLAATGPWQATLPGRPGTEP
jgi:hypothetical protein